MSTVAPVKAACLSCRQKKAKCDGKKPVCGQCDRRHAECIYIKSKRGGARKKRNPQAPSALQEFLARLDGLMAVPQFDLRHADALAGDDPTNVVRTFASREEILRCYYNDVHPYLAVMPPRHYLVDVLPTLMQPESPFLLAVQTIMTLIPHPLDPAPRSPHSKRLRSAASAALGRRTVKVIEQTLETHQSLEIVQALTILSVWEWGSTNDANASMRRAGQAVQVAMDLGIHDMDKGLFETNPKGPVQALEGIDWKKDAMRRSWWTLYVYQLTAGLVSGVKPPIGTDDERIMVAFPVCSEKDRTWCTWVNCIRQCSRVCNLVNVIMYSPEMRSSWGDPAMAETPLEGAYMRRQMIEVDQAITDLMRDTEKMSVIEQAPGGEEEVVKNQQIGTQFGLAVAHIHIHRHQAFPEVSLFSKRICGIRTSKLDSDTESDEYEDVVYPTSGSREPSVSSHRAGSWGGYPYPVQQLREETDSIRSLDERMAAFNTTGASQYSSGSSQSFHISPQSQSTNSLSSPPVPQAPKRDSLSGPSSRMVTPAPFPSPHTGTAKVPPGRFHASPQSSVEVPAYDQWQMQESQTEQYSSYPPPWFTPAQQQVYAAPGQMDNYRPATAPARPAFAAPLPPRGKPHKAWGIDENGQVEHNAQVEAAEHAEAFPPGISLARCATAAHTIVRLEVLHRAAALALDGTPRWIPFCACGLVSGAYAFLLLLLAVQAENTFGDFSEERQAEIDALLTNARIIQAGLEAYGIMWEGIDMMAREVRAAVEAAARLPEAVQQQGGAAGSTAGSTRGSVRGSLHSDDDDEMGV